MVLQVWTPFAWHCVVPGTHPLHTPATQVTPDAHVVPFASVVHAVVLLPGWQISHASPASVAPVV
jgi:hypothetical protein